ncbi:hypothetical protein DFJ58DRAFT_910965 [Suillus subalutaceus]|uniref:uncharacterized protein n=1 Tax=Suillus subalutaceus TaxID=48586 RepID=UPI001B85E9C7|nr:uncharacterized protein DFJ58DRAFT_910965 [Suillus subalutaceus]KAG1870588.1 hypothetical protein DFJ58DRAFT_910965 [Suillus subalutaceus]
MATSASFYGVVSLQNGSRYQIDKKNFWRYDGFIATPEIGDIRVNVFTFNANTASAEDGIYLLDARITIGPIIDDEGKSVHSLHLFASDPLPNGAPAFSTVIIAGKVSRSTLSVKQENGFDMDISQYVAGPQLNMRVRCYYPKGHPRFTKTPLPAATGPLALVWDIFPGPPDPVIDPEDWACDDVLALLLISVIIWMKDDQL